MRPIVGLSTERTATVVDAVRSAISDGANTLDGLASLGFDQGLTAAALQRLREEGELVVDRETQTFTLKE